MARISINLISENCPSRSSGACEAIEIWARGHGFHQRVELIGLFAVRASEWIGAEPIEFSYTFELLHGLAIEP